MPITKDFDTEIRPSKLTIKHIQSILLIMIYSVLLFISTTTVIYLISCYLDNDPPVEVLGINADDTIKGSKFHYHFDGYRKRLCEAETYRFVTDVKGQIVFSSQDNRPFNGTKRRYIIDDDYQLKDTATPGPATFHLFIKWTCPNNVVHLWKPITRDFSDNFIIYSDQSSKDAGIIPSYTPPPIPPIEDRPKADVKN